MLPAAIVLVICTMTCSSKSAFFILSKTDGSLEKVCLHLPSPVAGSSVKKRSRYSARIEAGRNGAPTDARVADGRLVFRKSEGNEFQSSIGLRSCMYPEIRTGAR
jgi:hypothetical protein